MRKRVLALFLSIVFIFSAVPNSSAEYVRSKSDIIREIAWTYYWNQDLKSERFKTLFSELERADKKASEKWEDIFKYWKFVDSEMKINTPELPDGLDDSDHFCIIVLGYQLNPDGTMQEELYGRLKTALKCAEKYPNAYVLCTGGGTASYNHEETEADAMAKWLIKKGVAKERILIENRSMTTTENAQFSYSLLHKKHPEITSVAIVTSDYHIPWGIVLFETQFILSGHKISVVSNAAYVPENQPGYSVRSSQINGILAIGRDMDWG